MARSSPRKNSTVATAVKEKASFHFDVLKKPRRPPRCSQCPGNPLRSECTHTSKGRRLLLEQAALSDITSTGPQTRIPPTESSGLKIQIPPRRVGAQKEPPPPTQSSVKYGPILLEPQSSRDLTGVNTSPSVIHSGPVIIDQAAHSLPAATENPSVNSTAITPELGTSVSIAHAETSSLSGSGNTLSFFSPASHAALQQALTPYRLNSVHLPDESVSSTNPSPLQHVSNNCRVPGQDLTAISEPLSPKEIEDPNFVGLETQGDSVSSSPGDVSSAVSRAKARSQARTRRATATSPIYGHVDGVLRGPDSAHEVYRTREKPSPVTSASQASKTFLEKMNAIFNQCENVSVQTGCWLFVGAQHANATGKPLHYASPRLRRDGQKNTNELATQFLQLIRQVTDARKVNVLELQNQLRNAEQEKARIEESRVNTELKLKAVADELEALKARNEREVHFLQEHRQTLAPK